MTGPAVKVYSMLSATKTQWVASTLDADGGEGCVYFDTEAQAKAWAADWLARERRAHRPFDKLICPWCGDFIDSSQVVNVRFELTNGTDVGMDVCKECSTSQPCRANVTGIHGEIYDGDYDGAMPPLPFEPDGQHGWCSRCALPMVWSVERQRWVDYPEELTPKGRLVRLMDALEEGRISQAEYDEALVGELQN